MSGRLIGVGVGPGDPELMTLKAVRALAAADVVAHFAKAGRVGTGRTIAAEHVPPDAEELALWFPVTTEIDKDEPAYRGGGEWHGGKLVGRWPADCAGR